MIACSLSQLARPLEAKWIGPDVSVDRVVTDSRKNCQKALFIALKGPCFDAHDYLHEVVEKQAAALLVNQQSALEIPQLIVKDTLEALTRLASYNRSQLSSKMVAITGSSGKTTVKEMLASILQAEGPTFATHGNLNNHIGVPLSLLEMNQTHRYGVLELGANQEGDIAHTAALVKPDVAMINNVAAAHLEGFGDLMGVARAKGEIYQSLSPNGTAVVNLDDDFVDYWLTRMQSKIVTFSLHQPTSGAANQKNSADVFATDIEHNKEQCYRFRIHYQGQECRVQLPVEGEHNVANALAAATCALALGVSLQTCAEGLAKTPRVSGRLMPVQLTNGCLVIDDTYNANLASMRAAIDVLSGYPGKRILVIGDMAELGESGHKCHEAVGIYAQQKGIDALYSCGVLTQFAQRAFAGAGEHFQHKQQLIKTIKKEAQAKATILVKGSRSAQMEQVVTALKELSGVDNQSHVSSQGRKN